MFKNVIAPVQAWLLSQGRCVGCGRPLTEGKVEKKDNETEKITCGKCGRIFIRETAHSTYRRALLNEA